MLFTCQKEEEPLQEQQISLEVETVKQVYNNQFNKKAFSNITNEPLWEHALSYQKNNISYIEVPFRSMDEFNLELSTSISMDRLMASIDNNGNLRLNIVHYYAKGINTFLPDFTQLNYVNPVRFNGYVTLYDMDKNRMEVNRYKDGRLTKGSYDIVKTKDKNGTDNLRVDEGCEMETETTIIRHYWFWIYDNGDIEIISTYDEYVETQYESCDGDGGGGAGGSSVVENEIYIQILDNLTGKAKCVFDKLKESSEGFRGAIKKFDGDFPVTHLKLINSTTLPSNVNASTSPPSNYVITIEINDNNLNRPNLSIARTITHETIHAEMFRKIMIMLDNGADLDGLTKSEWTQKLSSGDYPGIFDYYSRYGVNGMQHEQMAAHYRSTISDILEEFQPGLSQETYDSLAWEGLKNTTSWNSLSSSEKSTINSNINNYNSNGSEDCN